MARTSRHSSNTLDSPVCLSCQIYSFPIFNNFIWSPTPNILAHLPLKCFEPIASNDQEGAEWKSRSIGFMGGRESDLAARCFLPFFLIAARQPDLNPHLIAVDIGFLIAFQTLLISISILLLLLPLGHSPPKGWHPQPKKLIKLLTLTHTWHLTVDLGISPLPSLSNQTLMSPLQRREKCLLAGSSKSLGPSWSPVLKQTLLMMILPTKGRFAHYWGWQPFSASTFGQFAFLWVRIPEDQGQEFCREWFLAFRREKHLPDKVASGKVARLQGG